MIKFKEQMILYIIIMFKYFNNFNYCNDNVAYIGSGDNLII